MDRTFRGSKISSFIITLILLFPVLINSLKISGNLILLILFGIGLYLSIRHQQNPFTIRELSIFSWLTTGYFLVMLLSILYADGLDAEFHHLGRKVHFLLAPLIALAIFQVNFSIEKLLLSLKIGLIVIGLTVTTQFLFGHERPSGMMNANIFGDIAVAMFFLSIVRFFRETTKEKIVTLISMLAGISAILLSGSRGSWLSFIIMSIFYIILIYRPFIKQSVKRKKILFVFLLSLIGLIGFAGLKTGADHRIMVAASEIQNWQSGQESHTSLGLRMEMWKSGLNAAKQAPWLGYGYRNANEVASEYASHDKKTIKAFTHLHNEYITNLVSAGIIGLLTVLSLLFVPIFIFYQQLRNKEAYYYASMGILLCVGYATFGFSHIAFGEEHVNAFYIFFLGILLPAVIKNSTSEAQQQKQLPY